MKILYIDFTLKHNSLDIYVAGCKGNPHCEGCHNPETWNFNQGEEYNSEYFDIIANYVASFDGLIKNIMIFGGEPLDQPKNELISFLEDIKSLNKKVWLFTRYEINDIDETIKNQCDYIKTGRYIPELSVEKNDFFGINLATSNQKILKIKK